MPPTDSTMRRIALRASALRGLEDLGIIERDSEGRVTVPWDEIEVKVPLAA